MTDRGPVVPDVDQRPLYVIDTSAMIDLQVAYGPQMTSTVWDFVGVMADDGRLIAPAAVYREIKEKADRVARWAAAHRSMFVRDTPALYRRAKAEVVPRFLSADGQLRMKPKAADPDVVALALIKRDTDAGNLFRRAVCVVAHERLIGSRRNQPASRPSIPEVCTAVGLDCIRLNEMIEREE